jgi:hydrogenase-4 component B
VLVLAAALVARRLRSARGVRESETWSCGFARVTSRMEYTGSSYAQLFLFELAPRWLRPRGRIVSPKGIFPPVASLRTDPQDPARARLYDPLFAQLGDRFARLRRFQADRLNLQLFYTVLTVLGLGAALWLRRVLA